MFEILEIQNKDEYIPLLIDKNAPLTQAWFYGEWQKMASRRVRRFKIKCGAEIVGFFQVIKYPLVFSKNLLYIPHAPLLRQDYEGQAEFLEEFKKRLSEIAKEENAIFVRFDFYPPTSNGFGKYFEKVPEYAYHSVYFQPKCEWLINVDKAEGELLDNMHPKTRYNIHLAENKGITVEIVENNFGKYFEFFYDLLSQTAKRNNFSLHPKIYYKNALQNYEENKNNFLTIAKYGDKILVINLVLFFGETAYFVFGGSSNEHKNLMAPHLAHWRGIIESKNRSCKFYNFGAVNSGNNYKEFEGISRFKKGFGGRLLEYSDSYDLVLKPFWHFLYNLRKRFL